MLFGINIVSVNNGEEAAKKKAAERDYKSQPLDKLNFFIPMFNYTDIKLGDYYVVVRTFQES
jgi:hypothetical protein